MVKHIICLIQSGNLLDSKKYLFGPKIFCLNRTNFVSLKQNISLHRRKYKIECIDFEFEKYLLKKTSGKSCGSNGRFKNTKNNFLSK